MPTRKPNPKDRPYRGREEKLDYQRRPSGERRVNQPVLKFVHPIQPFEDAVLDVALSASTHTPQPRAIIEEQLAYFVSDRSVTYTVSRWVIRWNAAARKPYSTHETLAVRTIFLTGLDNVHYFFYDIQVDANGRKTRLKRTPYDVETAALDPDTIFNALSWQGGMTFAAWTLKMHEEGYRYNPMTYLRALAEDKLGKPVDLDSVYPMRQYFGRVGHSLLSGQVLRCETPADLAVALFGKKNYRKDLVKALATKICLPESNTYDSNSSVYRVRKLYWLSLFKGLVPIDWIIEAIKLGTRTGSFQTQTLDVIRPIDQRTRKTFIDVLKLLKPAERKSILMQGAVEEHIIDTVRMFNLPPFRIGPDHYWTAEEFIANRRRDNFHSFRDLHDKLALARRHAEMQHRRIADAERFIPSHMWVNHSKEAGQTAFMLEHIFQFKEIRIVIARDYDQLYEWSDIMNNCISSYFSQRDVILGGIYDNDNGSLIANFEIRQTKMAGEDTYVYSLRQLLGVYNARLDKEVRGSLETYFKAMGITIDDRVWW